MLSAIERGARAPKISSAFLNLEARSARAQIWARVPSLVESHFFSIWRNWYSEEAKSQIHLSKKSFFETLSRLVFWLVEIFLRMFWAHNVYVKCSSESKQSLGINESNTRCVEIVVRQLRAIFVHFKKWIIRKVSKFLIFPKLSLLQKSVSSLVNHKIKNNCHMDAIESVLEPLDNVRSKKFWFMSVKQKEKFSSQFFKAWCFNYYPSW